MFAHRARRQVGELRSALRRRGATTRQVAAAIAEGFGVTPQAAFRHAAGLSQAKTAAMIVGFALLIGALVARFEARKKKD